MREPQTKGTARTTIADRIYGICVLLVVLAASFYWGVAPAGYLTGMGIAGAIFWFLVVRVGYHGPFWRQVFFFQIPLLGQYLLSACFGLKPFEVKAVQGFCLEMLVVSVLANLDWLRLRHNHPSVTLPL